MQELQDIYRLQAFVTVVQEGSLSSAVNKLHITQPALSARLKLLEEGLGCPLLERTARGVRPTSMGKLVYGIAVDILKRMGQLQTTVRNHLELREGFVHLGGGATAVAGVFPDAISAYRKKYPQIQFTLHEKDSATVIESLHDGSVDVGLITRNPYISQNEDPLVGLKVHAEIIDSLEVIAAPEHPLVQMSQMLEKQGKALLPIHINRQPMILFESGSAIYDIIEMEFRKLGIRHRTVMTLRSAQSMIKMVEKNIGLSIVSAHSLRNEKGIHILKIQGLKMERSILICSVLDRELTPAASEFVNVLKRIYN
ncbi:LysR family transcriptional regulator [Fluviispira vulneris]|uniref:LysR family transcriptional regulator n=1 Tax=Fluviispira vulneris TaxID=2763012 RepID=UPI00164788DC|nr:LysR family transcriptional regulator [Fluviispira vulneris]